MPIFFLLLLLSSLLGFSSCEKSDTKPDVANLGYRYFPLNEGYWIRYSVEFIDIDVPIDKYDTIRYEIKEVFRRSALDSTADGVQWNVMMWKRADSTKNWDKYKSAVIRRNERMLLRTDNNTPTIKQCYPLSKKLAWNGNAYNNLDDVEYYISALHQPDTVSGKIFDSVACIVHRSTESLFEKKYEAEKYAINRGLILFQSIDIESQSSSSNQIDISLPIMKRITKGTVTTWSYAASGYDVTE